jgi:hypothetical protein
LCELAERGSVQALESLWVNHEHDFMELDNLFARAASGGRIPNMEWAISQGFILTTSVFASAVSRGHLEALKWLRQNDCPYSYKSACISAAACGHLHVLKWNEDEEDNFDLDPETPLVAARGGHLNVMEWIRECNPFLITEEAWYEAAKAAHFHVMQWMMEILERTWSIPDSYGNCREYCEAAVEHGKIDMFEYYREVLNHNSYMTEIASKRGQLDMLKHLHRNGFPLCISA